MSEYRSPLNGSVQWGWFPLNNRSSFLQGKTPLSAVHSSPPVNSPNAIMADGPSFDLSVCIAEA